MNCPYVWDAGSFTALAKLFTAAGLGYAKNTTKWIFCEGDAGPAKLATCVNCGTDAATPSVASALAAAQLVNVRSVARHVATPNRFICCPPVCRAHEPDWLDST